MTSDDRVRVVVFRLAEQEYVIEASQVQELVRQPETLLSLPVAPAPVAGLVQRRGRLVPVIDLRLKLRLKEARYDAFTVMIVLNVEDRVVGIVVDSVSDVIALNAEQIRPTPEFGASVDTRFISGIGTVDDRMLILLDIETLIDSADFGQPLPEQVAA